MTLDETIKTFEDIAKKHYTEAEETMDTLDMVNLPGLQEKALDHFMIVEANKQIADWLKELKAWREGKIVQSATDNTETIIINTDI